MRRFAFGLILLVGIMAFTGCGEPPPKFTKNFEIIDVPLKDGYISFKVVVEFPDNKGIREMGIKHERLQYAMRLMCRSIMTSAIDRKTGKRQMLNSFKSILRSQMDNSYTDAKFLSYEVRKK